MRGMDEVLRQKMSKRWRGKGEVNFVNMEVVGVGELVREKGRVGGEVGIGKEKVGTLEC